MTQLASNKNRRTRHLILLHSDSNATVLNDDVMVISEKTCPSNTKISTNGEVQQRGAAACEASNFSCKSSFRKDSFSSKMFLADATDDFRIAMSAKTGKVMIIDLKEKLIMFG